MNEEQLKKLNELFERERHLRQQWIKARAQLEGLCDPITSHVKECNEFWKFNIGPQRKIALSFPWGGAFLIHSPEDVKPAMVETYLPYGLNHEQIEYFSIGTKMKENEP